MQGVLRGRNSLKLGLVGVAILAGSGEAFRRILGFASSGLQIVPVAGFVVLFIVCAASLFGAALIRRGWLRWPLAIILAAAAMLVNTYQWAMSDFMTYDAFLTMLQSSGDLGNAAVQYGSSMAVSGLAAICLILGIGLQPKGSTGWPGKLLTVLSIPAILAVTALLFFKAGNGGNGLPAANVGTSYALLAGYEAMTASRGERQAVMLSAPEQAPQSDVVLIIDESIAGAYLDINNPEGVYSGLAAPDTDSPITNFGLAASITNCSAGANAVLRFGGTRDTYRQTIATGPPIWQFARKAGLQTVYLDAQRTGGEYQNMMDDAERASIDVWEQFDKTPVLHRDHLIADRLAQYLSDGTPQFILVNKIGAHFPVSDKFPDSHAKYRPMLKRQGLDVSEAGADDLDGRQSNWVLYRNSYRNTLGWNVGAFFDRFFAKAEIGDATIIYTSDHGQTFHERGEYGEATHCSPNPQIEEGVVPLVVIGGPREQAERWQNAVKLHANAASNYRIFPTLLWLMGYRQGEVGEAYGPDLFSPAADPFTFNTNFTARLGSQPRWLHIDIEDVQSPPVTDYRTQE